MANESQSTRIVHFVLGLIVLTLWIAFLANVHIVAPNLGNYEGDLSSSKPALGLLIVLLLPLISAMCFLFPYVLAERFSPRFKNSLEFIWSYRFWYFFGYLSFGVSALLILLFR